jgi:epoxyqueuosine reductase QueG
MGDAEIEQVIDGTALRRAGLRGLRRNLAVAIGNAGPSLVSSLLAENAPATLTGGSQDGMAPGLSSDAGRPSLDDPMVAEHIGWARSHTR